MNATTAGTGWGGTTLTLADLMKTVESVEALLKEQREKGRWILVAPNGTYWIGKDLMTDVVGPALRAEMKPFSPIPYKEDKP